MSRKEKPLFIYGTTNPAKLAAMAKTLAPLPVRIAGLPDGVPEAEEEGDTIVENARSKAVHYCRILGKPVFSCDSGLYLTGVPDDLQPGVRPRRPRGKHLDDDEMIAYYSHLAEAYGVSGRIEARYRNAICLAMDETQVYTYDGEDICSAPFSLCSSPHSMRVPGWPLDSLAVSIETGDYFFDMTDEEKLHRKKDLDPGFQNFFRRIL